MGVCTVPSGTPGFWPVTQSDMKRLADDEIKLKPSAPCALIATEPNQVATPLPRLIKPCCVRLGVELVFASNQSTLGVPELSVSVSPTNRPPRQSTLSMRVSFDGWISWPPFCWALPGTLNLLTERSVFV